MHAFNVAPTEHTQTINRTAATVFLEVAGAAAIAAAACTVADQGRQQQSQYE